jgi:hypothetical protein
MQNFKSLAPLLFAAIISGCASNGVADYSTFGINERVVVEPSVSNGYKGILVEMPPAPAGILEQRANEICSRLGGVKVRPTYSHTVPLGWKFYNYQCNGFTIAQPQIKQYAPTQPILQNQQQVIPLDLAKSKCSELGFNQGTEEFGKCVLQLTK